MRASRVWVTEAVDERRGQLGGQQVVHLISNTCLPGARDAAGSATGDGKLPIT